jgi:hypothetical protein
MGCSGLGAKYKASLIMIIPSIMHPVYKNEPCMTNSWSKSIMCVVEKMLPLVQDYDLDYGYNHYPCAMEKLHYKISG